MTTPAGQPHPRPDLSSAPAGPLGPAPAPDGTPAPDVLPERAPADGTPARDVLPEPAPADGTPARDALPERAPRAGRATARLLLTLLPLLAVGALCAALVWTLRAGGTGYAAGSTLLTWRYAACWGLFCGAVAALRAVPRRRAGAVVLVGGVLVALTGLVAPPRTSTDLYRYAWDGRVQAAGISPYDHAPADPALDGLRDGWLFPAPEHCGQRGLAKLPGGGCTRINRPRVHTIYPPTAELYFLAVHAVSPHGVRYKALQTGGAGLSVATTVLLLRVLRRRGDPRWAAYWAWCPAVPVEAVNNAHADVLAAALSVVALGLAVRRRGVGAGVLGAAIAAKLLPAVLLPGALSGVRRWRDAALTVGTAAGVTAALYVPYLAVSHSSVLGYLGGYAQEEGYDDAAAGHRYALLRLVLPDAWALPAVAVVTAAVAAHAVRRGDPARPWRGALTVTGTAFLLMTPGYAWYALLLVALVALDGRWEWLGVAVAGAAAYLLTAHFADTCAYAYGAAAVLAAAGAAGREASCRKGGFRRRDPARAAARRPGRGPLPGPRAAVPWRRSGCARRTARRAWKGPGPVRSAPARWCSRAGR